jgi:photosystem II stability/assembly factor-like uncharacterized protein
VATDREVYSSATRGDGAWRRAGSGLSAGFVWSLALDAGGRGGLYAGTDSGVFRSRPAGGRWRAVDKGLTGWSVTAVAPDSRSSATVDAGTAGAGVFKSGDRGRTWGTVNRGLRGAIVQALADDPSDPKTVYVGTYEVLDGAFAGPTRLYKSTDGAASWDLLEPGGADGFAFDPQAPATVYSLSGSLLRSTDRGGTWTPLMNGLPPPDPEGVGTRVVAVAVDPQQPSTLYIGTINGALAAVPGIFKSTDAGATWTESDAGLERRFPTALAVDPRDPATIYAGTSSGVLVSRDAGATWAVAGASSPRGDVSVALVDPRRPATVYAATAGAGVFESADAGRSWATLDRELSAPRVLALAPDAGATSLYAGSRAAASSASRSRADALEPASTDGGSPRVPRLRPVASPRREPQGIHEGRRTRPPRSRRCGHG